jgi:hypothetical protein
MLENCGGITANHRELKLNKGFCGASCASVAPAMLSFVDRGADEDVRCSAVQNFPTHRNDTSPVDKCGADVKTNTSPLRPDATVTKDPSALILNSPMGTVTFRPTSAETVALLYNEAMCCCDWREYTSTVV